MKLKTKLIGAVAAAALALPLAAPGAAFAQGIPAPRCIFLANGSGVQICFTPLMGTKLVVASAVARIR